MKKYTNKFVWTLALMFGLFAINANASVGDPLLINEILVNPNGGDSNCEFVEIIGNPSQTLDNVYFASIEGDGTSTVGAFDRVVDLSAATLGTNGLLVITNDGTGDCDSVTYNSPPTTRVQVTNFSMENGTTSWALILSPTTTIDEGTDYDTTNDGTLDALPGDATILDGFGFNDGGGSDVTYGPELLPTAGGGADAATRFPGNLDANSLAAWYYGDVDGVNPTNLYDLTQVSDNFPTGGMLTPGDFNVGSAPAGTDVSADFDGDGKTDYSIIRNTAPMLRNGSGNLGLSINDRLERQSRNRLENKDTNQRTDKLGGPPAPGTTLRWFISNSSDNSVTIADFGDFTNDDFITPSDFDGDGKDDLATWRGISDDQPSGNAFFFILNSMDSTVDVVDFGIDGDNPSIVGDYDGDGKSDPAVYRCDGPPFAQCSFFYQGSAGGGEITFIDWGNDVDADVSVNPGDFDGDGKFDFCIHRQVPGGGNQGQFVLLRSSDFGVEYIDWGIRNTSSGDFVVPGDYDGDGRNDFMVVRVESSAVKWYLLERDGGGTGANAITFGTTTITNSSEFLAQGDFDGDGATDIGIFRRDNIDPNNVFFYALRSSDGMLQTFEWGATMDFSVPGWNIN